MIALGDVRALASLLAFVDGKWPPQRPHLAIQSVPHLEAAIARLKALPPEPALSVPSVLETALGIELGVVRATNEVVPLLQAEDYAKLRLMPEQLFEQLDATRELFRGLVEWIFSPGNADRVEELREWIESRAN